MRQKGSLTYARHTLFTPSSSTGSIRRWRSPGLRNISSRRLRKRKAPHLQRFAKLSRDPAESQLPLQVLELYHRCALTMESECYTYPAKIHRTKQTNIEPLEIHYRVHAYAVKLVRKLRAPQLPLASANCERRVRVVREFLQVFAAYGVAKKTGSSGQAFYDTSKCTSVAALDQRDDDDLVVEHLVRPRPTSIQTISASVQVSDVVEMVDGVEQIEKMCRTAFETVLYKFPHYKAAYRLAEMHHNEKNNRACLNVVWNLFCGNKKSEPSALFDVRSSRCAMHPVLYLFRTSPRSNALISTAAAHFPTT